MSINIMLINICFWILVFLEGVCFFGVWYSGGCYHLLDIANHSHWWILFFN